MLTYKFRAYPSSNQINILNNTMNLYSELYNAMLQQRIYAYKSKIKINYTLQQDQIPELKESFSEFSHIHSQVLQDAARRLDKAFDNFFRRVRERKSGKQIKAGFPKFKSHERYNSITYPQSGFRIMDNGHIWISKIGEIRIFMHRPITGTVKSLSLKRDSVGDWFVTIVADSQGEGTTDECIESHDVSDDPLEPKRSVGIDLGLKSLITTSDGTAVYPPRYLRKSERKLKRAQKELSKKKKVSHKRDKAKRRLSKIHRKIERQRSDFAHKLSSEIVRNHDLIVFEDLNIKGMIKNHNIAKSMSDAGWDRIVEYTTYKAESAGSTVLLIDPKHMSQKCSQCGNIKHELKLTDRIYHCDMCNLTVDRDLNAAINIRNIGLMKVGRGSPEFTPVEIGALPEGATPVAETGSPLL